MQCNTHDHIWYFRRIHDPRETEPDPAPQTNGNGAYVKRPVSMYEARQVPKDETRPPVTQSLYSMATNNGNSTAASVPMPTVEEVTRRTELVTRRIQELWLAMQDLSKRESFALCAERIRESVNDLLAIFPSSSADDVLVSAVRDLNVNTNAIQSECATLQRALSVENPVNVELYLSQVRNSAYNLAKATKTLVTQFQHWMSF